MCVCVVITSSQRAQLGVFAYSRGQFAPEGLVSRDRFGRYEPRQFSCAEFLSLSFLVPVVVAPGLFRDRFSFVSVREA